MIFDSARAEILYAKAVLGDRKALNELHKASGALIRAIAFSLNHPNVVNDLIQEGHLKLQISVREHTFDRRRGSLYTFLSAALRNHMSDYLNKTRREIPTDCIEMVESCGGPAMIPNDSVYDIIEYMKQRFASLDSYLVHDAIQYIILSICEEVHGASRGVVRTLCSVYNLDRSIASTMYRATAALLRMELSEVDWRKNKQCALDTLNCVGEISLVPEMTLFAGKDNASGMMRVFDGSYVHF